MHTPTTGISKFLDKLLRPLFDKHARATTIIDGVDLIRRLDTYVSNGYVQPQTYLCTFDITDLYTMLPQQESLDVLTEFLLEHGYHKVQGVPIDIIRKLASTCYRGEHCYIWKEVLSTSRRWCDGICIHFDTS